MATIYKREGSPYYQASITVCGVRRRISTQERDRGKAQKKADAVEEQENRLLEQQEGLKFSAAATRFFKMKEGRLKPKTLDGYNTNFRNVYAVLGDFSLPALTTSHVTHYVNERMKTTGSVAIRRDLAFLSSLFTTAKHWEPLLVGNVPKEYEKAGLAEAKERRVWLRPEDVEALLENCTQPYQQLFILLGVGTGMRSSEIRLLRWDEIDFKHREIILDNLDEGRTKTGRSRIIPLADTLFDTLRDTKERSTSKWVLVNPATKEPFTTFKTFWKALVKRAGLKNIRIHDLRHTFASWAKQAGMDEVTIMDIMGHQTRSMVKRYSHTSRESLHESVKKMGRVTLSVTQPTDLRKSRSKKSQKAQ